ncbi:MAG TPA: PQQ-binding-like beta-propeller repeat protein [Candidatus Eremiobacteraceae bacterium]|nr:PQQ-binding-like beta-propeller repeat protein [Candidatus Eremiobacteraceae bacterium]
MMNFAITLILATALTGASLGAPFANAAPHPLFARPASVAKPLAHRVTIGVPDQTSTAVFVRNAPVGSRIDVYANGTWIGYAISRGPVTRVPIRHTLAPRARVWAQIRSRATAQTVVANDGVQIDEPTFHYDTLRTGWDPYESTLTTGNVSPSTFGQLWSMQVDGNVYAQPLYLANVTLPDSTIHNVLYVATCNDTLYAFDADSGATLWIDKFADPAHGITPVPATNVSNHNVWPTIGIVGTPAIDRAANALFVITDLKIVSGSTTTYEHQLHSIALDTGAENANSPVVVSGEVGMSGGGEATFSSRAQLQRPALLVNNGMVYVAFGSHGDNFPTISRGWVFAFDEVSLAQTAIYTTEDDPASQYLATIWMAGFGIAADPNGDLYFSTGNGNFDADGDFGDSVIELTPNLALASWFTPGAIRTEPHKDLGSGGVMVIPDQAGATIPRLAVMAGKTKNIYLMNRDSLGGYTSTLPDNVVQTVRAGAGTANKGVHGGPAYFEGPNGQFVVFAGNQDYLKEFALVDAPNPHLVLSSESTNIFPGEGGSTPVVTSNGTMAGTAIIWATTRPDDITQTPITLRAYDASNPADMLFEAPVGYWQNSKGNPYLTPAVANGKVYVGGASSVTAFGLIGLK